MKTTKIFKAIIFLIPILFVLAFLTRPAHALFEDSCGNKVFQIKKRVVCHMTDTIAENIDAYRTVHNIGNALMTELPTGALLNRNPDQVGACGCYLSFKNDAAGFNTGAGGLPTTDQTIGTLGEVCAEAVTEVLAQGWQARDEGGDGTCDFRDIELGSKNSGSLASAAQVLKTTIINEPPPVNLAFYVQDVMERTPFVKNTAFAQSTSYPTVIGREIVLDLWKITRNIAYGVVAIIMLFIGIMIMTRKKVNPQLVVTAQNAIPRVVISLVLITFSYPIGAVIASLAFPLILMIHVMFGELVVGEFADTNKIVVLISWLTAILGTGLFVYASLILIVLATIIVYILAFIKILFIYIKMIVSIVSAPIVFAVGAIPGKDELITNWFKKMFAYLISIPATFAMILMAWFVLHRALISDQFFSDVNTDNLFNSIWTLGSAYGSRQITLLFIPFAMLALLAGSLRVSKTIEEAIMGKPKRR
jgi:hypothetical protein